MNLPSKDAGSDPEALWLWTVMAFTARMQPDLRWTVYIYNISPTFSKEGMVRIVQN